MRAVIYDRYGPPEVLRLEDVARPVPKADEVLIKKPRHDGHPGGLRDA
jgi:NADPH:quinone reductase-like Zn-dependent oxidoreductase